MRPMNWEDKLNRAIHRYIVVHQDKIISFARELLRIPSVNQPPYGEEKQAQEFLAAELSALGFKPDLYNLNEVVGLTEHCAYYEGGSVEVARDYHDRPNLTCRWPGQGSGRSLIVAAHVDVVSPGDLRLWASGPWDATWRDGHIIGRGAVDDKGALAAMVMAVACLRDLDLSLQGDLILQSFIDEEYGGGNGALANLVRGYRADGVIMMEPTDLAICPVTYGCQSLKIRLRGQAAHAIEAWKGVNVIGLACQVYNSFLALETKRGEQCRNVPLFGELKVPLPLSVRHFQALTLGSGTVPDLGEMQVWLTTYPGETQETLLASVREHLRQDLDSPWLQDHPPEVHPLGRFLDATSLSVDHPLVTAAVTAYGAAFGRPPKITVGTSGDGYIYARYGGMPTIEFGPGPVFRAHAPNEYITVEELVAATELLAATIVRWCGVAE